ncbi:MAG TPA: sugar phosphate isomerase/epimerase, partial [Clostridia bacterium]|nr:sugar phosphate isomerase/epimerase [Clostridia bacterium]
MNKRPVTLCTAQWADMHFEELCALASDMGYDGLEIACWGNSLDLDRALEEPDYIPWVKDTLKKHRLVCKAIATHIIGQCVGDAPDPRLNNFAPARLKDNPQ